MMNQHVSNTVLTRKKANLWTPWGAQRVPDLDKALQAPRPDIRDAEPAWDGWLEAVDPVAR